MYPTQVHANSTQKGPGWPVDTNPGPYSPPSQFSVYTWPHCTTSCLFLCFIIIFIKQQRDFITAATFTFTTLPSLKRKRCCLSASLMCWLSHQRRGLSGQSVPAVRNLHHSYQPLCRPLLTGAWHKSVCVCVCDPPFRWVDGFKEDLYLLSGLIWEILTSSLCTFDSVCSCVVFISW